MTIATIQNRIPTQIKRIDGKYYLIRTLYDDLGHSTQTLDLNAKTGRTSIKLSSRVIDDIQAAIRADQWRLKQQDA